MSKNRFESVTDLLGARYSCYALAPEWVGSQEAVEEMLEKVLKLVPSHFNAQPVRMVLLTGSAHQKHWELVEQMLIGQIGKDQYEAGTKNKIHNAFMSGVGTVLFFDDTDTTKSLIEKFPLYADNFHKWAEQVQGSHQLMVWLGLADLGFGANLQHYIGMDDEAIKQLAQVPSSWRLIAQMPFGKALDTPSEKDKLELGEVLKVISSIDQ